jgi:hypothetical protein
MAGVSFAVSATQPPVGAEVPLARALSSGPAAGATAGSAGGATAAACAIEPADLVDTKALVGAAGGALAAVAAAAAMLSGFATGAVTNWETGVLMRSRTAVATLSA